MKFFGVRTAQIYYAAIKLEMDFYNTNIEFEGICNLLL